MNDILFYVMATCAYLGIGIIITAIYIVLDIIKSDACNMIAGVIAWPLLLIVTILAVFSYGLIFLVKETVHTLKSIIKSRKGE